MIVKEKYFALETINNKAPEILQNAKAIVERTKIQKFIPQNSALIVIDMQKYFCEESSHAFIPSSCAIIPKIKLLIENYKAQNLTVIFTQHINTPENNNMMGKWWGNILSSDSPISEIISEFNTEDSCLITKSQYDAFYNTDLEGFLKENKISQLVITGVMTNLCCETTARSAFVRGFETFLCVDSTATYNEALHSATMLNLAHGFSELTLCEELCKELNRE